MSGYGHCGHRTTGDIVERLEFLAENTVFLSARPAIREAAAEIMSLRAAVEWLGGENPSPWMCDTKGVGNVNGHDSWDTLVERVEEWAEDRGIIAHSTPAAQLLKTVSELGELAAATNKKDRDGIIDGIGDVLVTLVIYSRLQNVTVEECLHSAYQTIKDRKGRLTADGVFVKEADQNWMDGPVLVDPPSGHRYGFPKLWDQKTPCREWLIANGYPEHLANQGLPCRFIQPGPDHAVQQ